MLQNEFGKYLLKFHCQKQYQKYLKSENIMARCHFKRCARTVILVLVFYFTAIRIFVNLVDFSTGEKIDNNIYRHYNHVNVSGFHHELTLLFWQLKKNRSAPTLTNFAIPYLWRPGSETQSQHDDRIVAQLVWAMEATKFILDKGLNPTMKNIYLLDSFEWWHQRNWFSPHILEEKDCPGYPGIIRNCTFFENEVPNDVMHAIIMARDGFDTPEYDVAPNVLRFFYMLESPLISIGHLHRREDLLASFFRGSDVNTPYEKWVYYDLQNKFMDQGKNYSRGKTKMAAIFTSNCFPWNDRLGYIKELQKYVKVDVYGECGDLSCPPSEENEMCNEILKRDYLFYLSFENSNCRDYITEKLVKALQNDVLPIVLGAHPEDYAAFYPERSYLHVENFSSPEDLAKYMKHLAANPDEYNSFFQWKGTGEFLNTVFFCRICAMVHYADIVPLPERSEAFNWTSDTAIESRLCLPQDEWYWGTKAVHKQSNFTITKRSKSRNRSTYYQEYE